MSVVKIVQFQFIKRENLLIYTYIKLTNIFDSKSASLALFIFVVSVTHIAGILPPFIVEDLYYTFFLQLQNS